MSDTLTIEFSRPAMERFIAALNVAYAGNIHFESVEHSPGKANIEGHLVVVGPTMLTLGDREPVEIAPGNDHPEWPSVLIEDMTQDRIAAPLAGEDVTSATDTAESDAASAAADEPAPRAGSGDETVPSKDTCPCFVCKRETGR